MIWPPVKAWTSKFEIDGQLHFVAINYSGKFNDRWVLLMSVLDSNVVVKVPWTELLDPLKWECGWGENNYSNYRKPVNYEVKINTECTHLSSDSGLTIPIIENIIRPWFDNS